MSKAILVIDMPDECRSCPCFKSNDFGTFCGKEDENIEYNYDTYQYTRPDWCPLKVLPEYDCPSINPTMENVYYAQGWNDCVDEILESN